MTPKVKHRLHPDHPDDLVCDTCPVRYPYAATPEETRDAARFRGWRVYVGAGMTGKPLNVVCCPACFKTGAPPRPNATVVLEGQLDLPGMITPVQVEKYKKSNRQTS